MEERNIKIRFVKIKNEKRGYSSFHEKIIHPKTEIVGGVLEADCAELIKSFFRNKR